MIVELRHGAHGGARGAHRIRLVDGDCRWNPFDALHLRTVHAIETHPSSQSLLDHMGNVAPLLAKSRETADLVSMRLFGNASPLLAHVLGEMGQRAIPEWIPGEGHPAI